ncbi:MAG: DDE-type integrase/transposase/recombinase [Ruminiclostridium sp.]
MKYNLSFSCRTFYPQIKYRNNIIEQVHLSFKCIVSIMMGFKTFETAEKTISGIGISI